MELGRAIFVKSEYIDEVTEILEDIGLDINSAVNIFFKRVIKEQSISFLLSDATTKARQRDQKFYFDKNRLNDNEVQITKMKKSIAMSLFRKCEDPVEFIGNVSFSSKNVATNVYWSNPPFEYLNDVWNLILNDTHNRKLYLFIIPAGTIESYNFRPRADNELLIDLQIAYEDPTFTDTRSVCDFSFLKYLKKTIQY